MFNGSRRCASRTRTKTRRWCKNKVRNSQSTSPLCWVHTKFGVVASTPLEAKQITQCNAINQGNQQRCRKQTSNESGLCAIHLKTRKPLRQEELKRKEREQKEEKNQQDEKQNKEKEKEEKQREDKSKQEEEQKRKQIEQEEHQEQKRKKEEKRKRKKERKEKEKEEKHKQKQEQQREEERKQKEREEELQEQKRRKEEEDRKEERKQKQREEEERQDQKRRKEEKRKEKEQRKEQQQREEKRKQEQQKRIEQEERNRKEQKETKEPKQQEKEKKCELTNWKRGLPLVPASDFYVYCPKNNPEQISKKCQYFGKDGTSEEAELTQYAAALQITPKIVEIVECKNKAKWIQERVGLTLRDFIKKAKESNIKTTFRKMLPLFQKMCTGGLLLEDFDFDNWMIERKSMNPFFINFKNVVPVGSAPRSDKNINKIEEEINLVNLISNFTRQFFTGIATNLVTQTSKNKATQIWKAFYDKAINQLQQGKNIQEEELEKTWNTLGECISNQN